MKLLMISPPFSGHLHPLLGIGQRLAGEHQVLVATTPGGIRQAETSGLEGRTVLADEEAAIFRIAEPGQDVKNHPIRLWRQLKGNLSLMARLMNELDGLLHREQPDLVLADFTVPVAGLAAARAGVPWWTSLVSPCVLETPDGPPAYFGGQVPARSAGDHLRHFVLRKTTRAFKRGMWTLFRRDMLKLGLTRLYRADGSEAIYSPQRILALSTPEVEFPCTWPAHLTFTGPVLFTPPSDETAEVPDFPDRFRTRVLVTLGTHLPQAKAAMARLIAGIAERHPEIDFHFSHGKAGSVPARRTGNFLEMPFISYQKFLHRYQAVLHHAGAGIMNHCLHLGIPCVAYPMDYDQFDYAARLQTAGLAIVARRPQEVEPALLRALTDSGLAERCRGMQARAASRDGAETAARLISEAAAKRQDDGAV